MDDLITELIGAARAAAHAAERISTHHGTGTTPDPLDRDVLNAWLTAAITLATLTCNWPHPYLEAQGAHLHHFTEDISKTRRGHHLTPLTSHLAS